jgi:hypothetical protein
VLRNEDAGRAVFVLTLIVCGVNCYRMLNAMRTLCKYFVQVVTWD